MGLPQLPASLSQLVVPTGVHRRWLKTLWFGSWKTGKSFAIASFPKPLLAIDCGEGGVSGYLPQDDPDVRCLNVTHPAQYQAAVDWAITHEDEIASVLVDPITELWSDHMDAWQEELGTEEIRGGQWKSVKNPWKINLRRLMRANFHVAYTARTKDIEYSEAPAPPGEKAKLTISRQDVPAIEKTVGYTIDMIFETGFQRDKMNRPTPIHTVTFYGGRRPLSVSPKDLFIGRQWKFDGRNPTSVWDAVISPFLPQWENGAVDHLGLDPRQAEQELREMETLVQDEAVGRLIRIIEEPHETLGAYRDVFAKQIQADLLPLSSDRKQRVMAAHVKRKAELEAVK